MKINFLSEKALETLLFRENWPLFESAFKSLDNKEVLSKLQEMLQENPLKETEYRLPDDLYLNPAHRGSPEVASIRDIYDSLVELPHSIASDARFWAGLCIDKFWSYVYKRWDFDKSVTFEKVRDHFLFMGQSKKAYTRNALARLWWIGDLTIDVSRNNPYEITEFVLRDTDYIINLLERNFSSNRHLFKEFVVAVEKAREEGYSIRRKEIRSLCKFLNLLGGVYVLDALPRGMIYSKIYNKAIAISQQSV